MTKSMKSYFFKVFDDEDELSPLSHCLFVL